MEIVTYKEFSKWEKPLVRVYDTHIELDFGYPYEIEWSRIPNERAIAQWAHHISTTKRCDPDVVGAFILACYKKLGIDLYEVSY